jgi:hypothetical protein
MEGNGLSSPDRVRVAGGHHARAQPAPRTHQIYMSAVEIKGGTTTDKLPPPPVNPAELSKGYGFTGPGVAEKTAPQRWEVASYLFVPGFITAPQGDTVTLTAFVVNGDHYDVAIPGPRMARSWCRRPSGSGADSMWCLLSRSTRGLTT